uniref:Uncharacterized protein n=1 Tax=Rousettus aegyptiacus TaxID=9407 RepID=A0A7J8HS49_ROUAE|nr:hypothetical protein HJG63_010959 [Rousettus aegyptiacus]
MEKPASTSKVPSLGSGVFCSDSKENKIMEKTGHKKHTLGVNVSHHLPMRPSSGKKTSSELLLILHYGELYNYFIPYYNVTKIEKKCTINVMCLNHPEIPLPPPHTPAPSMEKLSSMKLVPGT